MIKVAGLTVALLSVGSVLMSVPAAALVKYSFTQLVGTGNNNLGALSAASSGSFFKTPVTFDFTIAAALPVGVTTGFSLPGLTYNGPNLGTPTLAVTDFNVTNATAISTFSLAQYLTDYPGVTGFTGRIIIRTDSTGAIVQYGVFVNGYSSYSGPLIAGYTAITTYSFTADSQNALSDARLLINVSNTGRNATSDFGDLICVAGGQGCGGSFTVAAAGVDGGGGGGTNSPAAVPEPASALLVLMGLSGVAALRRRVR